MAPTNATPTALNKIAKEKSKLLQEMFEIEPIHVHVKDPRTKKVKERAQGEHLLYLWDKIYGDDPVMKSIVVETVTGPSTPDKDYYDDINANPAMPYQQLRALVGDGGKWKWPEIWKQLDLLPRRGPAWRHIDDPSNLGKIENPNPDIKPLKCLVVGGGPVGIRLAIELALGGHRVVLWEKRREVIDEESGMFKSVGFTNRVNRPHINNFCRNDLDRLNGRNFMTPKMCYPVFTNAHTSSIGIDECQMLLMKTALLIGVDFRLGVGFDGADVDIENEKNQRPSWMCQYSTDDIAAKRYGMDESGTERFDCLFGCDGGRSRVRGSQEEWLGQPKTRLYKKMFGIVSNLRKVSKSKLRELGYSDGLEPEDRAGQTTGVFFYKASYHNYFIVHPSAEEMEANGIPWKGIFAFDKAGGEKNQEKNELKATLKKYITKKAKELNIPIDETLENDGFVAAPNDVMGFDFSEFYNCEKSAACFVPPLNWDVDEDGEWEIHCPLVALCGDAVADPNWLLGVGLRRGWTSAMDACFFADNIYNNKSFNGKPPDLDDPIEEPVDWSEHMDNIMNLMQKVGNASREGKLSEEMDTGMLANKGPVVQQIRKRLKSQKVEPPVPPYQIPVSPFYRYKEYQLTVNKNYSGKNLHVNTHPWTTREVAIYEHNNKYVERGDAIKRKVTRPTAAMLTWPKRFECSAFWGMMKLLSIDGKAAPGNKDGVGVTGKSSAPRPKTPEPEPIAKPKFDTTEVNQKATVKKNRLRESLVMAAMSGPHETGADESTNAGIQGLLSKFGQPKSIRKLKHQEEEPAQKSSLPDQTSPLPIRFRKAPPPDVLPGGFSKDDMKAIKRLSTQLADDSTRPRMPSTGATVDSSLMSELNLNRVKFEQDALKAKLAYAKAEVQKVKMEKEAVALKLVYAETEVQSVQKLLEAYKDMEDMMKDMH